MISKNKEDKASTWKANGIWKSVTLIKSNNVLTVPPFAFTCVNKITLTIKERRIEPQSNTQRLSAKDSFNSAVYQKRRIGLRIHPIESRFYTAYNLNTPRIFVL